MMDRHPRALISFVSSCRGFVVVFFIISLQIVEFVFVLEDVCILGNFRELLSCFEKYDLESGCVHKLLYLLVCCFFNFHK